MRTLGHRPAPAHPNRLYKTEKLCSETVIGNLFAKDNPGTASALAYPLRAVWAKNTARNVRTPLQFVIIVPKRRLRHAVERVTMRRRIREAYRLNRADFALPDGTDDLAVAFLYVGNGLQPSARVHAAMRRLLAKIAGPAAGSLTNILPPNLAEVASAKPHAQERSDLHGVTH